MNAELPAKHALLQLFGGFTKITELPEGGPKQILQPTLDFGVWIFETTGQITIIGGLPCQIYRFKGVR